MLTGLSSLILVTWPSLDRQRGTGARAAVRLLVPLPPFMSLNLPYFFYCKVYEGQRQVANTIST